MTKGERREAKRRKARYGMKVSGRSVQRLQEITARKAAASRRASGAFSRKRQQPSVRSLLNRWDKEEEPARATAQTGPFASEGAALLHTEPAYTETNPSQQGG